MMKHFAVFFTGLALAGCVSTQGLDRFCNDSVAARQVALVTITAIDSACPYGALTPDLEAHCTRLEKVRETALFTVSQIDAACAYRFRAPKTDT